MGLVRLLPTGKHQCSHIDEKDFKWKSLLLLKRVVDFCCSSDNAAAVPLSITLSIKLTEIFPADLEMTMKHFHPKSCHRFLHSSKFIVYRLN